MNEEVLACVRGVPFRQRIQPLPCSQIVVAGAGLCRPAVKQCPVDEQHLGGLGDGQDHLPPADHPLLRKGGDEGRQLLLAEIVPVVHQDLLIRQRQHRLGVRYEHIRQRRCARVVVGRRQHALMDAAAVADQLHLHADVLLGPDGAVELLDQTVQRGVHLAAVDVPQRHGQRLRVLFLAAARDRQQQHYQQT